MKRPLDQKILKLAILIPIVMVIGSILVFFAPPANAQCTALSNGVCRLEANYPKDFEFAQSKTYWTVVGVVPAPGDDKDIYLFDNCLTGWGLAGSTGTNGTDFIVGDFNHNALGTFYPQSLYGNTTATYTVYWNEGGTAFPVGIPVEGVLCGSGAECNMIQVYDLFLEIGAEYRITWNPPVGIEASVSLFRNPGVDTYWAPRIDSEMEITTAGSTTYVAPADDWYGLVVFPTWDTSTPGTFEIEIEKVNDCSPLTQGSCESRMLYTAAAGPSNDFTFTQDAANWAIVAVVPEATDTKTLGLYTACDADGSPLGNSFTAGSGETEFIVGDFNHNTPGSYYPRVAAGQSDASFAIGFDGGTGLFPVPGEITGTMEGCSSVLIWDVYLEAGQEYGIRFDGWGDKTPHAALFRNPAADTFWGGRQDAEFEISGSVYHYYTAPQTDWYGLVVFAGDQSESSSGYEILIQEMGGCTPLSSDDCESHTGTPRDFSFQQTDSYWAVVAVVPSEGDSKTLNIMTQCDLLGTNLAQTTTGRMDFIVGDFNHNTLGTYYPVASGGNASASYTIQSDNGVNPSTDVLPLDTVVSGSVGGSSGQCGLVRIWDLYLESGSTYNVGFTANNEAEMRLALFRNPGNGPYWGTNADSEWELTEAGNHTFTAPASDWYGLVAYTNTKDEPGNYTIRISEQGATGIEDGPSIPQRFALHQNAPNPFNPSTIIRYDVPAGGARISITVYDVNGRLVRTLVDTVEPAGQKSVTWNGTDANGNTVSTGVYFCRLTGTGFSQTRKMLLMK